MKFYDLCMVLNNIEQTSSRIEIRNILSEYFNHIDSDSFDKVIYILQSELFRPYEGLELNVGQSLLEESISKAYGYQKEQVSKTYHTSGDMGIVAYEYSKIRLQKPIFKQELDINYVYNCLRQIVLESGKNSVQNKIKIICALFQNSSDIEAKYIAKILAQTLRISLGVQTIIESAVINLLTKLSITDYKKNMDKFNLVKDKIEAKYNITYDLGLVLKTLIFNRYESLDQIKLKIGIPIRSALCEREKDVASIIKRLGRCIVEEKYDGFRVQVHHKKGITKIYSRRGEDITNTFPEFISILDNLDLDFIFDAEAIGLDIEKNKFMSFQETIKRKRKHDIDKFAADIPIVMNVFDIMLYQNKELINEPLYKRREILESLVNRFNSKLIRQSGHIYTDNEKELLDFLNKCLDEGLEGVIAKDLNKPYIPGSRDFAWIKLKKNYLNENLDSYDLVIIGYKVGRGKNANLPSRLICAVYDKLEDRYIAVTGLGSGLSEQDIKNFSQELDKIKISSKPDNYDINSYDIDYFTMPSIVVEIVADEVTKTKDGISLRFPRFIKIRDDKDSLDTTTIEELERIHILTHTT